MGKINQQMIHSNEIQKLVFSEDPNRMNWFRSGAQYASVICPEEISCKVEHDQNESGITTRFIFTNVSETPVFTNMDSIGIRFPLEDRYDGSEICIPYRCNTHIFCGGNVSYVMALRMGGQAPHLGMYLTKGSLSSYSIERSLENSSNDRGCFILHPSPLELSPGEIYCLEWVIFSHNGKDDFQSKLMEFHNYLKVESDKYVLFQGEVCRIKICPSLTADSVTVDGKKLAAENGTYSFIYHADNIGEKVFDIYAEGVHTWCRILVQPAINQLARKRSLFIADHQQYQGKCKSLAGAYLIYDNEEHHCYYNSVNDYNGGRERVGMGILILRFLQCYGQELDKEEFQKLDMSIKKYNEYLKREIIRMDTGEVCNNIGRDNSYQRLYNFPWYATYFTELYRLYQDKTELNTAVQILNNFYLRGGDAFYAIELPINMLCEALSQAGMAKEKSSMELLFIRHADHLVETGLHYPALEVNYEQSIVAPAASIILQVYQITKEQRYLEAGKIQLNVLEQFNGIQPDYHLYETAIRHWDGYWFGKRELFGDTYPHYWSGLTGDVYKLYAEITGDDSYLSRAESSLRGVLPLFFPDGTASCAYLFPHRVNGIPASFYDPYANDQDWGLYFYLRYLQEKSKVSGKTDEK